MDLLKTHARDRGGSMLVKRTEMASKIKLFVDVDFLITEDWKFSITNGKNETKRKLLTNNAAFANQKC